MRVIGLILLLSLAVPFGAQATSIEDDIISYEQKGGSSGGSSAEVYDPLEPMNRSFYNFNKALDKVLIKPTAHVYKFLFPPMIRTGIGNTINNLGTPVTFANHVLQANLGEAGISFWRFVFNSTIGIAGIFDVATPMGLRYTKEDLGQTFGYWGINSGPYVVLPVIGPSSLRDSVGRVGDWFIDPFTYILDGDETAIRYGVTTIHTRSLNLDLSEDLDRVAIDEYATVRSLYLQNRQSVIDNKDR